MEPAEQAPFCFDLIWKGEKRLERSGESENFEMSALRLDRSFLRHVQREDAVLIGGGDAVHVDLGDVEAAGVGAVVTLAADVFALVVLLVVVLGVLGLDREGIVVDVDLDILFLEAGQLGLELVGVVGLADVGAEAVRDGRGVPERSLHLLHLPEGIEGTHAVASAVKRHDFEHFILPPGMLYNVVEIAGMFFNLSLFLIYKLPYNYEQSNSII